MTTTPTPQGDREALLPCPFCGGEPFVHEIPAHEHGMSFNGYAMPPHDGSCTVECSNCGLGIIDDSPTTVIATWQRRAPATPTALASARLEARAEALEEAAKMCEGSDLWPFVGLQLATNIRTLASHPPGASPDAGEVGR